jgi:hypothetical protein
MLNTDLISNAKVSNKIKAKIYKIQIAQLTLLKVICKIFIYFFTFKSNVIFKIFIKFEMNYF